MVENKWTQIQKNIIQRKTSPSEITQITHRDVAEREGAGPRRRRLHRFTEKPISEVEKTEFTKQELLESIEAERHKTELSEIQLQPGEYYQLPTDKGYHQAPYIRRTIYQPYYEHLDEMRSEVEKLPDEPGLVIERTREGGFRTRMDYSEWERRQHDPVGEAISIFMMPIGEGYEYAKASITGPTWEPGQPLINPEMQEVKGRSHYQYQKLWESGDVLGLGGRVLSSVPGFVATSYGLGRGFGVLAKSSIGSKNLLTIGKTVITPSRIIGGTALGIGVTSGSVRLYNAYQKGIDELKKEIVTMGVTLGVGVSAFRMGYRSSLMKPVSSEPFFKKEAMLFMDKSGTVRGFGGQRYFNLFGRRFNYGRFWYATPKGSYGYTPKPSYPVSYNLNLSRSPGIFSNKPVGDVFVTPSKTEYGWLIKPSWQEPIYKPETIGLPTVFSAKWLNKNYLTGLEDLRPKIEYEPSPFEISTKVWPKLKPYRAYETYYRFFTLYKEPYRITKKPVYLVDKKPFHKTLKDVIKSDLDISKSTGGQIQRTGTITIQKPKVKSITDKLVVPESLLKPVYKRVPVQEVLQERLKKSHIFKDIERAYDQQFKKIQKRTSVLGVGIIPGLARRKASAKVSALNKAFRFDTAQLSAQARASASARLSALSQYMDQKLSYDMGMKAFHTAFRPREFQTRFQFKPTETEIGKPGFPRLPRIPQLEGVGMRLEELQPANSYELQVKKQQYRNGRRIRKGGFTTIGNYSKEDALRLGGNIVGNNAKASFKLNPSNKKPQRLRRNIPGIDLSQFYTNNQGVIVEKTAYRINTPQELRQITMKGIKAPRKKKRRR